MNHLIDFGVCALVGNIILVHRLCCKKTCLVGFGYVNKT